MSYNLPTEQPTRRKSGGGMLFFIMLAIGAYLIFARQPGALQPPGNNIEPATEQVDRRSTADRKLPRRRDEVTGGHGNPMPSSGKTGAAQDCSMNDVATQQNANSQRPKSAPAKTENGNWAMEEVDPRKSNNNQFKFSNPTESTSGGDWQIDDAKGNKKTENGDWSIEEISGGK